MEWTPPSHGVTMRQEKEYQKVWGPSGGGGS